MYNKNCSLAYATIDVKTFLLDRQVPEKWLPRGYASVCPYGGPELSRQKQKHHGKTKDPTVKPKTSRQNQILHRKSKIVLVWPWVFAFAVRYSWFQCYEVFGLAVRSLVLPPGFWFCREVFCFCREVFSFAVTVVGHRSFSPQNLLSDPLAFSRVSVGW